MSPASLKALSLIGLLLTAGYAVRAQDPVTLEIETSQTAVLDPVDWDKVIAGERYFDAVRPLLVRFPGAAAKVDEWLQKGYTVDKLELVLRWQKQEGARPERGRGG